MAYVESGDSQFIDVKRAYASVQTFVKELYGHTTANYMTLEELELDAEEGLWLITVAFRTPTGFVTGKNEQELKRFLVNATNGEVISMKIYQP